MPPPLCKRWNTSFQTTQAFIGPCGLVPTRRAALREAATLLLPLAQADNVFAIDALATLGQAAASSVPVLQAMLAHALDKYTQARTLRAVIRVVPDAAAVVDTLVRTLLGPLNPNLHWADYAGLKRFSSNAAALVPADRHSIETMRRLAQKEALRTLILAMALPATQQISLLAKLD